MPVRTPPFKKDTVPTHGFRRADYFVLHVTEGGGDVHSLAAFFRGTPERLGITFATEPNGTPAMYCGINDETYHVEQQNSRCIGLEQIGYARTSRAKWLTVYLRQIYMAAWIVAWASEQCNIPLIAAGSPVTGRRYIHSKGITQHMWVPLNDHNDCGSGYPFDKVMALAVRWKKTGGPSLATRIFIGRKS